MTLIPNRININNVHHHFICPKSYTKVEQTNNAIAVTQDIK